MEFVDFPLNPDLIAQNPSSPRDACKMMQLGRETGNIENKHFYDLGAMLGEGDVLVFNNTKVFKARVKGCVMEDDSIKREEAELFLLKRVNATDWEALCRPGRHFRVGRSFVAGGLNGEIIEKKDDGTIVIRFTESGEKIFALIEESGSVPLPPYIQNSTASMDDYQTLYAEHNGSVAAPTAGLHFTEELLAKLSKKGVAMEFVTLHVGRGTFATIKTEDYKEHKMHSEWANIDEDVAKRLSKYKKEGRRIIAVGTTSVRTLESFSNDQGEIKGGEMQTDLYIYPPYRFKFVDSIITNFHLPKSTLLLMIGAFTGTENLKNAYEVAMNSDYRFFSFGDAMFIN